MVATVAGIHLGIDTHANRPAANTVPDGSLYSCSTDSLVYKSNFAGNSWATWATLGSAGGGGAPLGVTRYAPGTDVAHATTTSATQGDVDATNAAVTFTAPASGNVIVSVRTAVGVSSNQNAFLGLRESTTNVKGPSLVCNAPTANLVMVTGRDFYVTGITVAAHTYKLAFSVAGGATLSVYAGPTYGHIEMTVWAA